MGRMDGKVAVVTGGASGIGEATVRRFVQEGARAVVIGDLQHEVGEDLAAELGATVSVLHCDVTREADVAALVDSAVARFGRLDVMFNNAGFGGAVGPIDTMSVDDFDLTVDVLLKGAFLGMKHAARVMKPAGRGSIVSTSSGAGLRTGSMPHLYSTCKAAVIHLTRSVANELADDGIRVNCVCPGFVVTPLVARRALSRGREVVAERMEQERVARADTIPLRRAGEADDIARAVLFLASDDADWITGDALVVDGGALTGPPWRDHPRWMRESQHITLHRPEGR